MLGIPVGTTSLAIGLKNCAIAAGVKKYKSIIKKKKKKHDKIVLLAKAKLNSMEPSISKTLIDSNISHDEFILKKKWKIERLKQFIEDFSPLIKQCDRIVSSVEKKLKVKTQKLQQ